MKTDPLLKSMLLAFVVLTTTSSLCSEANASVKNRKLAANTKAAVKNKKLAANPTSTKNMPYTRVDFEVHGSKCPACIRRLVKKYRKSKGVIKVDIGITKPYGGVIIFDHTLTSFERLKKRMKEEKVKPINVETEEIKSVPPILIPKSLRNMLRDRKKKKQQNRLKQNSRKAH